MSRIGKQQIVIPANTQATLNGDVLTVKGPAGTLTRAFSQPSVSIAVEGNEVKVTPTSSAKSAQAMWGTYASHVKNMIEGVNKPFEKKLIVEGVGFKVDQQGSDLVLKLGFSHSITVPIPEDLNVAVEKNTITVTGPSKESVGQFSASVRALKKPEPYKGKGIHYSDEVVRRKQGKKVA